MRKKKRKLFGLSERPAFVSIVQIEEPIIDGYTLRIDFENCSASIINLKEGGKKAMVKTIVKAKEGFEELYDIIVAKKEAFEVELEEAKAEAVAEVEQRFAARRVDIENIFAQVSVTEEVEEPDEVAEEVVGTPEDEVSE